MYFIRVGTLALLLLAVGAWCVLGSTTPTEHQPDPSMSASVAPRPGPR